MTATMQRPEEERKVRIGGKEKKRDNEKELGKIMKERRQIWKRRDRRGGEDKRDYRPWRLDYGTNRDSLVPICFRLCRNSPC
ncbi:hypothetical protein Tco_0399786 [Tanacetum coccineum]